MALRRLVLGQIQAAGVAINLFRAQVSVTLDVSWKGKDYAQALGRTCRRGQTEPCLNIDLIANKLGRILNGDPSYADNWHDIAGYASLIDRELNGETL